MVCRGERKQRNKSLTEIKARRFLPTRSGKDKREKTQYSVRLWSACASRSDIFYPMNLAQQNSFSEKIFMPRCRFPVVLRFRGSCSAILPNDSLRRNAVSLARINLHLLRGKINAESSPQEDSTLVFLFSNRLTWIQWASMLIRSSHIFHAAA